MYAWLIEIIDKESTFIISPNGVKRWLNDSDQ